MTTKNKAKAPFDPVVLILLGIVLIAVAIGMAVIQSGPNSVDLANDASTTRQLFVAFVTGLTTGGLSCLAVQGGLLASSLAHQIVHDLSTPLPSPALGARKHAHGK